MTNSMRWLLVASVAAVCGFVPGIPGGLGGAGFADVRDDARSRLSQVSGTLALSGLKEDVTVVRDKWGIPHIYAKNADDLFFAQGYVQAQDRLFQMDLWRRGTQGHLAEILGEDYLERDRLSRLLQYKGPMDVEWASYGPGAKQIIAQFVKGINAWVDHIGDRPPIEFTIAGYAPGRWQPEDILSRAEGFLMSGNATTEVWRSRLVLAVGAERAAKLLPPDPVVSVPTPNGIDLQVMDRRVSDALAKIGAGASGFGQNLQLRARAAGAGVGEEVDGGSNNWVVSGAKSATGRPLLANDPHRALDHPSLRYLVHLNAPGWNVIGAGQPWLPGVSFGHNDRVAWGATLFRADVQDLYVEKINPQNPRQYEYQGKWVDFETRTDEIRVKGLGAPQRVELQYTRHGPVILVEIDKHLAFALRSTGAEPGTAAYLGSLGIDQVNNCAEFRRSLKSWKVPGENLICADVDGNIAYQAAALTPVRKNWPGLLPVPGWTGEYEWAGWYGLDDLPHEVNPKSGFVATANHNTLPAGEKRIINYEWSDPARINRIREVLMSKQKFDIEDFERLQHDSTAWNAGQIVPLFANVRATDPEGEAARKTLVAWDRNVRKDSAAAALYVVLEQKIRDRVFADKVPGALGAEYPSRAGQLLVPLVTAPTAEWFGANATAARDRLLVDALAAAVKELKEKLGNDIASWKWGNLHNATFRHALAGDRDTQQLLNIGPIPRSGYGLTPFATGGRGFEQNSGSSFRDVLDPSNWDRSVATSAPGQSGQPLSPHFDDLAKLWGNEQYFPLSFTRSAVNRNAEATLTLTARGASTK
jgi:penicillin amidase